MPPKQDRKLPPKSKAQLMTEVTAMLITKWPNDPIKAIEYTLNFYTAWDLVAIHEQMEKELGQATTAAASQAAH